MSFEKILPVLVIFLFGFLFFIIRYGLIHKKDNKIDENKELLFKKKAKKFKTWSIVNTCIFSVFILPILAIMESNKAQKSLSQNEYNQHIRRVVIYNICTYLLLIPFSIIMKTLESKGMIN